MVEGAEASRSSNKQEADNLKIKPTGTRPGMGAPGGPSSALLAPNLPHILATPPPAAPVHLGLRLLAGYCGHCELGGSLPPHTPSLFESSVGENKHFPALYSQRRWCE